MTPKWGTNWEDDLAGAPGRALGDPNIEAMAEQVRLDFESVFMFYLPRICEHCLNPSCVASCPSGAMYKREEDGIVLVDQDRCRGWRFCVSGCPYKKVYFNHRTGKAEKCTLCFPVSRRACPLTARRPASGGCAIWDSSSTTPMPSPQLPPPSIPATSTRPSSRCSWIPTILASRPRLKPRASHTTGWPRPDADRLTRLIVRHRVALALRPDFRTMPMVWYVPPLSPVADVTAAAGYDEANPDHIFAAIDTLRIPVEYLANLFTAGRVAPVRDALRRLAMVRTVMRAHQLGQHPDVDPAEVGLSEDDAEDLFRLLAIARYEDRYVVPPAHAENAGRLLAQHSMSGCSLDEEGGPGMGGVGAEPQAVPGFHLQRQESADDSVAGRDQRGRLHLRVSEHPPSGPFGTATLGGAG